MKSYGEIMNILEAFDLTGSYRGAAELAGCDHKTVKAYVERRNAGLPPEPPTVDRDRLIDGYRDKLAEWMRRSDGRQRADVAHRKLVAFGYARRNARRGVRSPPPGGRTGRRGGGRTSRGSPNRAAGCSSTAALVRVAGVVPLPDRAALLG